MIRSFFYLVLFGLIVWSAPALAQKEFNEGIIIYKVTIEPPGNQEGVTQYQGTYTLHIKGNKLKKVLVMNNGFRNTTLYNSDDSRSYSLREVGSNKYAVILDPAKTEERRKRFENYTLKELAKDDIDGFPARKAFLAYKNGQTVDLHLSTDWKIKAHVFDRFPGIEYLPLAFMQKNDDGAIMHFKIDKIDQRPLENNDFNIPTEYKIVKSDEFKN